MRPFSTLTGYNRPIADIRGVT